LEISKTVSRKNTLKPILLILGAIVLAAALICLQLAAMRRRHPNAELLTEALTMISEAAPGLEKCPVRQEKEDGATPPHDGGIHSPDLKRSE
jgi:hypothetical protein